VFCVFYCLSLFLSIINIVIHNFSISFIFAKIVKYFGMLKSFRYIMIKFLSICEKKNEDK